MRKLKDLWQLIKGIFKDRTPYIVVYDICHGRERRTRLAWSGGDKFGGGEHSVFVGNWDGAYRFMQYRQADSQLAYRIAIAGDVAELAHLFPQYK